MNVDLGDLPGWITALIAFGGVIFGGYNLRKLTLDRQRAQADRIYFGLEFNDKRTTIHVMNLSDAPITSAELYFRDYPEWTWSDRATKPLVKMSEDWELHLYYPEIIPLVLGYLSFTDASNRTWYKLSNGKLYSYRSHPGPFAQLRFFPSDWMIRVRTLGMKPQQKAEWLRQYGFLGGLFRWGFHKQYE